MTLWSYYFEQSNSQMVRSIHAVVFCKNTVAVISRYTLLIVCGILLATHLKAQSLTTKVDLNSIDQVLLESLILKRINAHRKELGLSTLATSEKLSMAASDHAYYLARLGKLSHEQKSFEKQTVARRVKYFGGDFGCGVAENVLFSMLGKNHNEWGDIEVRTYDDLAEQMYQQWKHSPGHYKNMIGADHRLTSLRFYVNPRTRRIYAVQVFGGQPWIPPAGVEIRQNAYGVFDKDEKACECMKRYNFLSEHFANYLRVSGDSVFISYVDLAEIKSILNHPKDALALDLVFSSQIPCGGPNTFHSSEVHDGLMLPPVSMKELFGRNRMKKWSELYTFVGKIPEGIPGDYAVNLIVIKEQHFCSESYGLDVEQGDLDLLPVENSFVLSEGKEVPVGKLKRELVFAVDFPKAKSTPDEYHILNLRNKLFEIKDQIRSVRVVANSSVEGSRSINERLQKRRAASIFEQLPYLNGLNIEREVITKENWKAFYADVWRSAHPELALKDSLTIKKMLLADPKLSEELEPILREHRKVFVEVKLRFPKKPGEVPVVPLEKFAEAVREGDVESALKAQSGMIEEMVLTGNHRPEILTVDVPNDKSFMQVYYNQYLLAMFFEQSQTPSQFPLPDVRDVCQKDSSFLPLRIAWTQSATAWLRSIAKTEARDLLSSVFFDPEELNWWIEYADGELDDEALLTRMKLNYHLAAVDYYWGVRDFGKMGSSLSAISRYFDELELDEQETLKLAKYFNSHYRMSWSIRLMKPWIDKHQYSTDFLYTYLSASIFYRSMVPRDTYLILLKEASRRDQIRFCELMNSEFQRKRDPVVKNLYCNKCN